MNDTRSGVLATHDDAAKHLKRARGASRRRVVAWVLGSLFALVAGGILAVSGVVASRLTIVPRVAPQGSPADFGLRYEDVRFPAREDRLDLGGWHIHPQDTTRRCTVLLVHGIYENRADPTIKMLNIAADLARNGYGVFAIDLRAHGASAGERISVGYYERRDVLGAIDYLKTRPDHAGCIVGLGFSMGGAVLINAADEEQSLKAVVADSSFASLRELLDERIPEASGLPRFFTPSTLLMARLLYGMDLDSVRPEATIATLAPRPVLIIHGADDQGIPVAHARRLYEASDKAHTELWIVPGVDHVKAYSQDPKAYINRVVDVFNRARP